LTDFSHILSCEKVVEYSIFVNEDVDDSWRADVALFVPAEVVPPNSPVLKRYSLSQAPFICQFDTYISYIFFITEAVGDFLVLFYERTMSNLSR